MVETAVSASTTKLQNDLFLISLDKMKTRGRAAIQTAILHTMKPFLHRRATKGTWEGLRV